MKNKGDFTNPKFELKLRSEENNRSPRQNVKNGGLPLKGLICLVLITGAVGLKLSSGEYAGNALSKLEYILSKQTDFTTVAEDVVRVIDDVTAKFGRDSTNVSTDLQEPLCFPLKNVSVESGFTATEHPVFNTTVEPTGIVIKGDGSDFVYSAADGDISSLKVNADGTYRISLRISKNLSVSYDGLKLVYFSEADSVRKSQIIGVLPEESALLSLSVWSEGEAADPKQFFSELND